MSRGIGLPLSNHARRIRQRRVGCITNRTGLIGDVARKTALPQATVAAVIDSAFSSIDAALIRGERVSLPQLGVFSVQERPERPARNPRTGEMIVVPAKRLVKFRASKVLRDRLVPSL